VSSSFGAPRDEPILVIQKLSFMGAFARYYWAPTVYVTSDGVMITQAPNPEQYPGPALPNLRQRTLGAEAIARLRQLATEGGLEQPPFDYHASPVLADTTRVTYLAADGRTVVHEAYALGSGGDDQFSEAEREARAKLAAFVRLVRDEPEALAPDVGPEEPYIPQAFELRTPLVEPRPPAEGGPVPEPAILPWPLPSIRIGAGQACTPVTGPDAETLLESMRQANELTRWDQNGQAYRLDVQVSLPGEGLCR
jgi:hypothetical protein